MLRFLPPKSSFLPDDGESTRLALFGPGIESPRTKLLVHKVVNSHTDVFDAVSFVGGLPGGFGSGVRINFRKLQTFDLMCLYTNSARAREERDPAERLARGTNKLLSSDQNDDEPKLHESVVRLLPTVHALLFAVDSASLSEAGEEDREAVLKQCERELRLMASGVGAKMRRHTPVLVLSCRWGTEKVVDPAYLASRLGLEEDSGLPWAVYDVAIGDMEGMARALDWVLYHCQKRRNNLQYHKSQSEKLL